MSGSDTSTGCSISGTKSVSNSNLSTYLFQHETKELWPSLLVLTGMAAALIKPKKYTYKFIGVFSKGCVIAAIATFHSVIL